MSPSHSDENTEPVIRILGIDPGLGRIGFGVLDWTVDNPSPTHWAEPKWGLITTDKHKSDGGRLQELYEDICSLLQTVKPQVMSIEKMFFFRNITTAFPVSQARGVILLAASQHDVPVFEYTPMQVKQTLTGYGKAEKRDVQEMLVQLLGLRKKPTPDDAADALALAYSYIQLDGRTRQAMNTQAKALSSFKVEPVEIETVES